MYTVIAISMGSRARMMKGRATTRLTRCDIVGLFLSSGAQYLVSPVSLRNFSARLTRIIGAYVSGIVKTIRKRQKPEKNVRSQKTQRQETPATDMKPLMVGPMAGPANGARVNIAMAFPRVSASQMSAMRALQILLSNAASRKVWKMVLTHCLPKARPRRCHPGDGR